MYLACIEYPNLIRLFGYSSRNQKDDKAYVDLLTMRMKAKHGELSDEFLNTYNLTNDDLKIGLKLPLNAYTGTLRATFNPLFDNLQGFSICSTGQLLLLQLAYELKTIPTVEITELNTDAVQYMIDDEYKENAYGVINKWEKLTGLELEQDKIVKLIQRDVNNFAEILQIGDNDYEVHYKGGELTRGEHKFKWDKENKIFRYSYKPSLKSNSMSICSEALLKYLLFDIPIEDTINKCNDMIRFQIISHLGSTYEKCVQESENGDVELQRNNRIYAGLKPSGSIMKIKPDGRRDSLANCPINPIVDNDNELTIDEINKEWYIDYAKQKANDFLGTKRLDEYKKDELFELAKEYNIITDKKMKKIDIINIIKDYKKKEEKKMEIKKEEIEELKNVPRETCTCFDCERNDNVKLLKKINEFRKKVQEHEFVLDKAMDDKHGGNEYSSIGQFYNFVQQTCLEVGLDFTFEPIEQIRFEKNILVPSVGAPKHLSEIKCVATFTDIDTACNKSYVIIGSGSDSMDKSSSSAMTLAFRNWFKFNFTPKEKFDWDDDNEQPMEVTESPKVKVPAYVPPKEKEEIKKEVVATEQHSDKDSDDADKCIELIYQIRELMKDDTYGAQVLGALQVDGLTSVEIDATRVALENRLETLKKGE